MSERFNPLAFPSADVRDAEGNGIREGAEGMTLRDYIATHILAGVGTWTPLLPTGGSVALNNSLGLKARASWAYAQADAMLAARG